MKLISNLFLLICVSLVTSYLLPVTVSAKGKNIFGLHLTQTSDIFAAKDVVNSSGGQWGWITLVVRLDKLDQNTWQEFFDNCRKFHLTPIVRLATYAEGENWKRPSNSDIDTLANFLNSLNWPSTQRHIILFNEVNHGLEWGGEVDIKNFADTAIYTYQKFKSTNQNFTLISSPLDLASPEQPPKFKSAENVYREIYLYKPEYFESLDALGSHSYPNHGFIGTPKDTGRHSIHGYQWELNYLKKLGISKEYPVFITETGWPHREGENTRNGFYTTKTTSKFLLDALQIWQNDSRVQAVTPFIYNYPNAPFDHFSWVDKTETLYSEYQKVIDFPKSQNSPSQSTKYKVTGIHLPLLIFSGNQYSGQITLKNTGESIWGETNFCLNHQTTQDIILDNICTSNKVVYPNQIETFNFNFTLSDTAPKPLKTYISWENLPSYEITSVISGGSIYRPQFNLKDSLYNLLWQIFK